MSRSINELLKTLAVGAPDGARNTSNKLENPDIPEPPRDPPNRDRFYSAMRMPSQPRNGTFALSVPREPWELHFMADGDIDPNTIRKKVDPDRALPDLNSRTLFQVPTSALRKPQNQIGLIRQSHTSELNWKNRFTPANVSNTQPVVG